ncbi:hypothetical protein D3C77_422990 [compost metagenome]
MRCNDDRLAGQIAFIDHFFLHRRDIFDRNLHTQISPGHHNTVRSLDNVVEFPNAFIVLNFRNNLHMPGTPLLQKPPDFANVIPLAYKRYCDHFDPLFQTEGDMTNIPFGYTRKRRPDSR